MNQKINKNRIDDWHQVFADLKSSGLTIADFCRKNNLSSKRVYHWHKRLGYSPEVKKKVIAPKFIPVEIKQVQTAKFEIDPSWLAKIYLSNYSRPAIMKSISEFSQIFLCKDFVDMRLEINGLSLLVEQHLHLYLFDSQLFVFTNKACNRIKILYWDKSGFALWLKRLEKSKFKWLNQSNERAIKINSMQLQLLLDGIDLSKLKPHKNLSYKTIF